MLCVNIIWLFVMVVCGVALWMLCSCCRLRVLRAHSGAARASLLIALAMPGVRRGAMYLEELGWRVRNS